MDAEAAKLIGAGIPCIGMGGAGIGVGAIFGNYLTGALRNPAAAPAQFTNALIGGKPATQVITDHAWLKETFVPDVQKRGAAVIKARGASSAASAANAALDTLRSLHFPTPAGD